MTEEEKEGTWFRNIASQKKKKKTAGCRDIPLESDSFDDDDDDALASLTMSLPSPKSCRSKGNEVRPNGSATARSSSCKAKNKHPTPSVSSPRKARAKNRRSSVPSLTPSPFPSPSPSDEEETTSPLTSGTSSLRRDCAKDRQPITPSPRVPQPSKDEGISDNEETEEEDLSTPSSPPSPPPKPPSQLHSKPTTSTPTPKRGSRCYEGYISNCHHQACHQTVESGFPNGYHHHWPSNLT